MTVNIDPKAMYALKDYSQAEAYVSKTRVHTVYIDNSRISNIETKDDTGMMFRMIKDGRVGKASVTLDSEDSIDDCLAMADTVLGYSPVTQNPNDYPYPEQAKISAPDVFDPEVESADAAILRDLAQRVIDATSSCKTAEVKIPRAQIRLSVTESRVMNGNGVDVGHRSTLVYGHFTSMCVRDHPGEGIATFHGTHLTLDPDAIGTEIARQACDAAICREFKGHVEIPMALCPGEGSSMILSSVGSAVHGENVRYKRSPWTEKSGETVASECLNITDDPTVSAPLSCIFDDEGTPAYRKDVIENGVLKGFLRDSFCGNSTGNAMRRSSVEPQGTYERTPTIKPLNLRVKPGTKSKEEMISEFDDLVLVDKFASPECDELSGAFGLNVRSATVYHRGEPVQIINNALMAGNMFDCLKDIRCICDDSTQTGVVELPTICYGRTELIGN